jgi:uncharacterized protein YkwD
MAHKGYFDHKNSLGQGPSERVAQQGYVCRKDFGVYYTEGVAENIFQTRLYSSVAYVAALAIKKYMSDEEIAQSTVEGWMESPGHHMNLLDPNFDRSGIGVAVSSEEKVYITQDLC